MKEIEIKAHAGNLAQRVRIIAEVLGTEGSAVEKRDQYFREPGAINQAFRMRNNNGNLEFTSKRMSKVGGFENNFEFEFHAPMDQWDNAEAFFLNLGYERYFRKHKTGFEWYTEDGVHIELFDVNDIGCYIEMEILADMDITEDEVQEKNSRLIELLLAFGLHESDIEPTSYREMILAGNGEK